MRLCQGTLPIAFTRSKSQVHAGLRHTAAFYHTAMLHPTSVRATWLAKRRLGSYSETVTTIEEPNSPSPLRHGQQKVAKKLSVRFYVAHLEARTPWDRTELPFS